MTIFVDIKNKIQYFQIEEDQQNMVVNSKGGLLVVLIKENFLN
jgi:hypothetical protein